MDLLSFFLLNVIDKYPIPINRIIQKLLPLGQQYSIPGVPTQRNNFYRFVNRLTAAGYIHLLTSDSPHLCYATTPRGKQVLTDFLTVQESLVTQFASDSLIMTAPISKVVSKPVINKQKNGPNPTSISCDDDRLESLHEILVEYIPPKSTTKIASFSSWCIQTPKLTAETIQTKLITTFWGDERLVPRSMTEKFPELIERLFGVL